ncbi:MAG: HesA/MoeB/ThiF family protein [Myxococcales bacterium]|nr:HesA/MoeB/ThiF family protein [Myxococcales bacterium]
MTPQLPVTSHAGSDAAPSPSLSQRRVLLVGAGGLGSAAAPILARAGVGHIDVLDDDRVEASNLQRQTLYSEADCGRPKAPLALERLRAQATAAGYQLQGVAREMRLLPGNAAQLVADYDLVLEGADNHATKFLVADACALGGVPAVQGGAVRWVGWAMASRPGRGPCLRCVFEDMPGGEQPDCAAAGVVGPAVGVIGALQAALALKLLLGLHDRSDAGALYSLSGLHGSLRRIRVPRRPECALCSGHIQHIDPKRYAPPQCAA